MEPAVATRILRLVATEASEEPDTIARRPEVIDLLAEMADDPRVAEALERVTRGQVENPSAYVGALADALRPYRDAPLDDAPHLVEALAFMALVSSRIEDGQPTSEMAAVALV